MNAREDRHLWPSATGSKNKPGEKNRHNEPPLFHAHKNFLYINHASSPLLPLARGESEKSTRHARTSSQYREPFPLRIAWTIKGRSEVKTELAWRSATAISQQGNKRQTKEVARAHTTHTMLTKSAPHGTAVLWKRQTLTLSLPQNFSERDRQQTDRRAIKSYNHSCRTPCERSEPAPRAENSAK